MQLFAIDRNRQYCRWKSTQIKDFRYTGLSLRSGWKSNGTDRQLSFFVFDAVRADRDCFAGGEMIAAIAFSAFAVGVGIGVVAGGISAVFEFNRNARKDMRKE